jgi:hypothetical protein
MKSLALLVTLLSTAAACAQTEAPEATSSPVARVYVSRPTHVDAFDVSSFGKLTPVPGSPFSNIALSHMSVNKEFLFGASDDGTHILTYSISSKGALKEVASIDADKYCGDDSCYSACGPVGPTQLDHTGVTLYNYQGECDDTPWTQSFKIDDNGELQFLNRVATTEDLSESETVFLGNNDYAYSFGSSYDNPGTESFIYKRESDGTLSYVDATMNFPKPVTAGDVYNNDPVAATDPANHLVLPIYEVNPNEGDSANSTNGTFLISYTADSKVNLTTTNTLENAPTYELEGQLGAMSISPSAKLLAIGAGTYNIKGFQVFHFNGADPIAKYTGVLHSSEYFLQFGWDKANHLFALSSDALHIYDATSTSIKEEPGSPISIPEASSVIVLSLQ